MSVHDNFLKKVSNQIDILSEQENEPLLFDYQNFIFILLIILGAIFIIVILITLLIILIAKFREYNNLKKKNTII